MKYWINTISRDHVQRGVASGFTQANHGKAGGLQRLNAGDWIIFYSPKTNYQDGKPLQAFTAIGQVTHDKLYQFEMVPDFIPWCRKVDFKPCVEMPIKPLINDLSLGSSAKRCSKAEPRRVIIPAEAGIQFRTRKYPIGAQHGYFIF